MSQYFAYRGLYLTDGVRITEDADHVLDHKTVIVIEDDSHDFMSFNKQSNRYEVQPVPVITADKNYLQAGGKFRSIEEKHIIRLNSFDGEGMISPQYGEFLSTLRSREVTMRRSAVSFQIRMPFIKGMLHQVNFHQFFNEYLPEEDYYIKDVYGIPRRIADARIILTESMFKCVKWLKEYCKEHTEIPDPMEWFFEMFHKYDHALYVCNTDANMGSQSISLTYQFLNTLDITPEALENLVRKHLNEAHTITETGGKYALNRQRDSEEELSDDENAFQPVPAWRYALSLNPDFIKDPHVRTILGTEEHARQKDICTGRITANGVMKFLSGDLLALLIHMIYSKRAEKSAGKDVIRENGLGILAEDGFRLHSEINIKVNSGLKKQLIRTGKFYTADADRLELRTNKRYGILRSPHLSRNEECSLRPFVPDQEDTGNVYNKYFSHLKNVIMFPYESIDAMSLGGADYDGDTVALVLERAVNDAILRGSYIWNGKDYERRFPVVEIPSLKARSEPGVSHIPFSLIERTFSNQVGTISNLAIKIGKLEYGSGSAALAIQNKCAECTLAVGLDIDAVKTGVRPDIGDLGLDSVQKKDYFLEREGIIKKTRDIYKLKVTRKGKGPCGGDKYEVMSPVYGEAKKQYQTLFDAEVYPLEAQVPAVDRLPGYFLKDMSGDWKSQNELSAEKRVTKNKELLLFKFQTDESLQKLDPSWSRKLEAEKKERVSSLIKAYVKVAGDVSFIRQRKEKAERSKNINKIWFLMQKIFDPNTEGLPLTHTDIPDAIDIALIDFYTIFDSISKVDKSISRMKELDWSFAPSEDRETMLYDILGTEKIQDETKEILLCDEADAFDFLKFYLYEARNEILKEASADQADLAGRKDLSYLEGYSLEDYRCFIDVYKEGQKRKEPRKVWNATIVDLCRRKMASADMFNNDFDLALKYYYACRRADPNRYFLWEVFETDEILRNIFKKPKE